MSNQSLSDERCGLGGCQEEVHQLIDDKFIGENVRVLEEKRKKVGGIFYLRLQLTTAAHLNQDHEVGSQAPTIFIDALLVFC